MHGLTRKKSGHPTLELTLVVGPKKHEKIFLKISF